MLSGFLLWGCRVMAAAALWLSPSAPVGLQRRTAESWLLLFGCHLLLRHPNSKCLALQGMGWHGQTLAFALQEPVRAGMGGEKVESLLWFILVLF